MPVFEALPPNCIHMVDSPAQVAFALRTLAEARFVGFDTEAKPVFSKEVTSDGPHVIQFATLNHAFIVQVGPLAPSEFLQSVIESSVIVKVGFGLKSDRGPLWQKLGIRVGEVVDLSYSVRKLGYREAVGLKTAVAIVLGRRLSKPKSVTTSNWALPTLRPNQLTYAAQDAYASLAVFHALGMPYAPRVITAV